MATFLYYLKFVAVLIAALLLGRWYDQERNLIKAKGEATYKTWLTPPGIMIIIILILLVGLRIYLQYHPH